MEGDCYQKALVLYLEHPRLGRRVVGPPLRRRFSFSDLKGPLSPESLI